MRINVMELGRFTTRVAKMAASFDYAPLWLGTQSNVGPSGGKNRIVNYGVKVSAGTQPARPHSRDFSLTFCPCFCK